LLAHRLDGIIQEVSAGGGEQISKLA